MYSKLNELSIVFVNIECCIGWILILIFYELNNYYCINLKRFKIYFVYVCVVVNNIIF